ncbi:FAD-dependent oxidoreductase [Nocardia sp. NPDC050406]|uniref:FAD-dependent oxidoreductase n=1 Tax=Nocardia sp. NPDC050406 TaxID=3364318 RepID=UPI0037B4C573
MYDVHEPRVLVVGGGLVGLSAALFLRHHGVRVTLVERRHGTSPQPKARRIDIRTMEAFRQIGIADEVFEAARDLAHYQAMAVGPTVARAELLPFELPGVMPDWEALSPTTTCLCAQDVLEPVLRRLAEERGAQVRFGVELTDFREDDTGIEAEVRAADGATERLRAAYLIAADGAASPVRERLGIRRSGRGTLGKAVTVYFRADLEDLVRGREFNLCQVENESLAGAFASVDGRRRWIFYGDAATDRSREQWPDALRLALGAPEVDIEILSVLPWEPGMFVADEFQRGRILLAGDAAHVMPPYAAAGANTGIQDVHDLAWKLGFVLRGAAGPELVETYAAERHPIGWLIADQSSIRTGNLRTMNTESADGTPLADPIALMLGTRYPAGALIDDGSAHTLERLDLAGQPGTRLPNATASSGRSVLDLVDTEFVLFTGPTGAAWRSAGVVVHEVDESYCATVGIESNGALLVRPDQIVAWRCPTMPARPDATVTAVLDRILSRD